MIRRDAAGRGQGQGEWGSGLFSPLRVNLQERKSPELHRLTSEGSLKICTESLLYVFKSRIIFDQFLLNVYPTKQVIRL